MSGFFGGDNKSDDSVIVFFLPSGSLTKRTALQSAFGGDNKTRRAVPVIARRVSLLI